MNVTAFIPVRGGSKSIPLKNIKSFCGKPLIYWSLIALQKVDYVDEIIVATDSDQIEEYVQTLGFNKVKIYRRLSINAKDESSTESVMLEYLSIAKLPNDKYFMLVQATSPLTTSLDFIGGLELLKNNEVDSVLSCVKFKRFLWNKLGKSINYDFNNRPRRQEFEGDFLENGAFYISRVGDIMSSKNRLSGKIAIYEMPEYTSFEIDEPADWTIVENIMKIFVINKQETPKQFIKLFMTDVDGVLTDAGMYYSNDGNELKKFNTHDGMAFSILREYGIKTAIITSENTEIVKNRANKLKVDYLFQGKKYGGKLDAAIQICKDENISLKDIAYIGDDINCLDLLSNVGFAACPADAVSKIKEIENILILNKNGGKGVVREFVDYLIQNRLLYETEN